MSSKKDIRNKNAVRILEDLKILENRGSGIPTILREMRELKLEPPKFEERRGDFWVTFKNHTLLTKQDKEWLKNFGMGFTENEALALSFIRKNEVITNSDYQKLCNLNRDKSLIEIKGLLSKGLVKAQGVGRGTVYTFSDKIAQSDDMITPKDNSLPPKMIPKDNGQPPKIAPKDNIENVEKILNFCMEAHSKKEILEYLSLSDAKNMEKTYIYPLLNEGKLKMTLPDKPSSKNQKYETVRKLT